MRFQRSTDKLGHLVTFATGWYYSRWDICANKGNGTMELSLVNAEIEQELVELLNRDLESIEHRVLETQGVIEIETNDVNESLRAQAAHTTGLNRMKIRQPNLEDLFLDLTGHSLRA